MANRNLQDRFDRLSKGQQTSLVTILEQFEISNYTHVLVKDTPTDAPFPLFSKQPKDPRLINFLEKVSKEEAPQKADHVKLAKDSGISLSHLRNLIKSQTGHTLYDACALMVIEKCKDELKNTDEKIGNIALDHGFENPSHFSRVFKNIVKKRQQNSGITHEFIRDNEELLLRNIFSI